MRSAIISTALILFLIIGSIQAFKLRIHAGNFQTSPIGSAGGLPIREPVAIECVLDSTNYPGADGISCQFNFEILNSTIAAGNPVISGDDRVDGRFYNALIEYNTGSVAGVHEVNVSTVPMPLTGEEDDWVVFTVYATEDCPEGYFLDGSNGCNYCPKGSISTSADSASCSLCDAGSSTDLIASTSCKECPPNSFSPVAGSTNCLKCGKDRESDAGSTECKDVSLTGLSPNQQVFLIVGCATLALVSLAGFIAFKRSSSPSAVYSQSAIASPKTADAMKEAVDIEKSSPSNSDGGKDETVDSLKNEAETK